MNSKIQEAVENLKNVLVQECSDNIVSVKVFVNAYGAEITFNTKTPEELKANGYSMKNIGGEWVK